MTSSSDFVCRQERLAHPFPAKSFSLQLRPTAGEPAWSSQVARRGEATATKKSGTTARQGEATGCGATRTS